MKKEGRINEKWNYKLEVGGVLLLLLLPFSSRRPQRPKNTSKVSLLLRKNKREESFIAAQIIYLLF